MEILTYALLSYFFIGLSHTIRYLRKDAGIEGADRGNPSLGKDLSDVFLWPIHSLRNKGPSEGKLGRKILHGGLSSVIQWAVMAGLIFVLYAASVHIMPDPFFRIMVIFSILMLFVIFFPLNALVERQVNRLISWFSGLISPEQKKSSEREIKWCGTCRHHQKMSEYEDLKSGLWHDSRMPESDQLPCRIFSLTSDVWQHFYTTDPMSRTIFPRNCLHFEGKG